MPINDQTQMHGAAVLVLFEALGKNIPNISFSLKTGESNNCYLVEAIKPSVLGKGKRLSCGLYIKTASMRRSPWRYNYLRQHQDEIRELKLHHGEVFNVFVNGNDGFACVNYETLKTLLDEKHEEQEWIAISRKPREAYRISGNDGREEQVLRKNNFPNAIIDYFKDNL